jgi:RHS repeat-associated protein
MQLAPARSDVPPPDPLSEGCGRRVLGDDPWVVEAARRGGCYGIKAYTAREWDPEINLYYYRARYYDPKIGRFISEDPLGFKGGVNRYGYVGGGPMTGKDPFGLVATKGCRPQDAAAIQRAADKAVAKVKSGCLPCGEGKEKWIQKIQTTTYHCDPNEGIRIEGPGGVTVQPACGMARPPVGPTTGKDVTLFWPAFYDPPCGCLEGVLFHEIAHIIMGGGHSDSGVNDVTRGCFSCAKPGF